MGYEDVVWFAMESRAWMASGNETANVGLRFVESFRGLADEAVERTAAQRRSVCSDLKEKETGV